MENEALQIGSFFNTFILFMIQIKLQLANSQNVDHHEAVVNI